MCKFLKLYGAQYLGINNVGYLVADNFDEAKRDAETFANEKNPLVGLTLISDRVNIDFKRENERVNKELED